MRSPVQIWLAAPWPLKPSGFGGFLLLSALLRKKIFTSPVLKNTVRPHPFLSLLDEGMRSDYGQKNHNEWTHWTVHGRNIPEFFSPKQRRAGLARNSVSTYVRVLRTFLNRCQKEGRTNITFYRYRSICWRSWDSFSCNFWRFSWAFRRFSCISSCHWRTSSSMAARSC